MKKLLYLLALLSGVSLTSWVARENPTLLIRIAAAGMSRPVEGLKVWLQDESTGQNLPLQYDAATLTIRVVLNPDHRYTVAVDAPGYTPYRKYIDKVSVNKEIGINLSEIAPQVSPGDTKYTIVVVDKDQRSVVPDAVVKIMGEKNRTLSVTKQVGSYVVILPNEGDFMYEVTANEYEPQRAVLVRRDNHIVEVGLSRIKTQTVSFVAQDAFTHKPLAARFRLKGSEATATATVTTASHPEFGTEVRLNQPYQLQVTSDGYDEYTGPVSVSKPEPEPIKPRVILLQPSYYEIVYMVMNAGSLEGLVPSLFRVREAGRDIATGKRGNTHAVRLRAGHTYEIRVEKPGFEPFERTLVFDRPVSPQDLRKSILLAATQNKALAQSPQISEPDSVKAGELTFSDLNVGDAVRLDNVYFDQSSYRLRPESHPQLDKLAKTLEVNPKLKIEIAGHTDNVGDARLNQFLSENRAKVISSYLINRGISESRLVWKGYGPTKPLATNDTEENKARNRRVEIVVLDK